MANRFLYVYRTARDDGFEYAVGEQVNGGRGDGGVALFRSRDDAITFVYAERDRNGAAVHLLPSAES